MKITYKVSGKNIKVYLDNKRTGTIRSCAGGYAYFIYPSGDKGDTFKSIDEVKKSLLCD